MFVYECYFLAVQDIVDPVRDEMLAKFVVDSHFRSQPKGSEEMNMDGDDAPASLENLDPEVNFEMFFLSCSNIHVQSV